MSVSMGVVIIRVLAGFLAGIAAGILIMREVYRKQGWVRPESNDAPDGAVTKAS